MLNVDPSPYRWQDHVIPPHRTMASLVATAVVILAVGGAGLLFASSRGAADASPPPARHATVTERTPPLCQLARRPGQPPHTHTKSSPL
jgi:hypothetical protein